MSCAWLAYALRLSDVENLINSKNGDALRALTREPNPWVEEIDQIAQDIASEEDIDSPILVHDALRHIIFGENYNPRFGFAYGYALQIVCEHFGELLSKSSPSTTNPPASTGCLGHPNKHQV